VAGEAQAIFGQELEREYRFFDLLRRPGMTYARLMELSTAPQDPAIDPQVVEQVEISARYQGYIERQRDEVERLSGQETRALPADLDYSQVVGLSREVQQKLAQHRPETLGQASRIQGVTPAAIALLLVHLKKREYQRAAHTEDGA